jgi:hypothetical protein
MRAELLPDACVIVRPGLSKDRYGNEIADWSTGTREAVYGRLVPRSVAVQGNGELTGAKREYTEAAWALILPAGTVINSRCRVETATGTFMVQGHPVTRRTMSRAHHITANLSAVV